MRRRYVFFVCTKISFDLIEAKKENFLSQTVETSETFRAVCVNFTAYFSPTQLWLKYLLFNQ